MTIAVHIPHPVRRRIPMTQPQSVDLSSIPMEWRRVRLKRLPVRSDSQEKCWWLFASTGRRRRLLNSELPDANAPLGAAICQCCGHGYSELYLEAAKQLAAKRRIVCPDCGECRWDIVAITAINFQDESGVFLGVSNVQSGDLETERHSREKIMRERGRMTSVDAERFGLNKMKLR